MKKNVFRGLLIVFLMTFVVPMIISVALYDFVFDRRIETLSTPLALSTDMFPELQEKKIEFPSNLDQKLAGFVYQTKGNKKPNALIIVSHGIGNTHIDYLREIDAFVKAGYWVFAYDGTGCGKSGGSNLIGLEQAPIDLQYAIQYIQKEEYLKDIPLLLYGHSWGGYAVSAALYDQSIIKAAIVRSGFSDTGDMLLEEGAKLYGNVVWLLAPYISIYERVLFAGDVDRTGVRGLKATNAKVLVLHSKDDKTISLDHSLYGYANEYKHNENVTTLLYEEKSHNVVNAQETIKYRDQLYKEKRILIKKYGNSKKVPKGDWKRYYEGIDYELYHRMDQQIMKDLIRFFDEAIKK